MKFKRVYHHMDKMEEFHSVMWKQIPVDEREAAIAASASLMIDSDRFYKACKRACAEWPNSTEANLTASVINHGMDRARVMLYKSWGYRRFD